MYYMYVSTKNSLNILVLARSKMMYICKFI